MWHPTGMKHGKPCPKCDAVDCYVIDEAKIPDVRYADAIVALTGGAHRIEDAIALLGPTTMGMEGRLADAHEEHRRIVAAIAAKDGEEADREARAHVGRALDLRRRMRGAADGEPGDQPPA